MGLYAGILTSIIMLGTMVSSLLSGVLIDLVTDLVSVFIYEAICMCIAFVVSFLLFYINKDGGKEIENDVNSYQSMDTTSMVERVDYDYQQFGDSEDYHNVISTDGHDEESSLLK